MRAAYGLAALVVGLVSGAAGTLVHQRWWGLALALAAELAVLAWLPAGGVRLAFAVLLVAALVTAGAGRRTPGGTRPGRADDPGVRGLPS